jgi:hypothetical protein
LLYRGRDLQEEQRLNCALRVKTIAVASGAVSGAAFNKRFRCKSLRTYNPRTCLTKSGARPFTVTMRMMCEFLRRKEVIQPQVPLRLPCYDFIPVTSLTLGLCLLAVGTSTSGATGFHDVTGGVYKTRERIHGAVDDAPLLAIPTSWRRVAASNPN